MSYHQSSWVIFVWELVSFSGIFSEKLCSLEDLNFLNGCASGETCLELNSTLIGKCTCRRQYTRSKTGGPCVLSFESNSAPPLPSPEGVFSQGSSASAITVGLLVPLFLLTVIITLGYAAKKYRWLHRVREHAHQLRTRQYDTVLVNQEDDPPLA